MLYKKLFYTKGNIEQNQKLNKINYILEILLRKDILTSKEQECIESFMNRLNNTDIFDDRKCLCHNDFSCNHILLDENNRFSGVIDFGDAGIIDEYCDFIYLLKDSEEEIGHEFGEDILKLYGNINAEKAKEYQRISEEYYPIETIVYGVKNNKKDFIEKGRKLIKEKRKINNRI